MFLEEWEVMNRGRLNEMLVYIERDRKNSYYEITKKKEYVCVVAVKRKGRLLKIGFVGVQTNKKTRTSLSRLDKRESFSFVSDLNSHNFEFLFNSQTKHINCNAARLQISGSK